CARGRSSHGGALRRARERGDGQAKGEGHASIDRDPDGSETGTESGGTSVGRQPRRGSPRIRLRVRFPMPQPSSQAITIATRESRLALWQAEHVKALLEARGHPVTLLGMTTLGDQILDRT